MNISPGGTDHKRHIRYDRLIICAAALVILCTILILAIGHFRSSKHDLQKTTDVKTSGTLSTRNGKIEFEKIFLSHDDIYKGPLILTDDSHEFIIPDDFRSSLVNLDDVKNSCYNIKSADMQLESLTAKCFNSMMSGYYAEKSDNSIMITNSYITPEHQNLMFNQALDNNKHISRGGFSEHQTGLAFDLGIYPQGEDSKPYSSTDDYSWITENCMKYGFIWRYPDAKSDKTGVTGHEDHFRYVGIPHAFYMSENDLTLEEYLSQLKNYSFGDKSLSFSCFSKNYEIYYIKATQDVNDVYVPSTNSYTISGNNEDGFIITVEK